MRIVIIEDEPLAADKLEQMIRRLKPETQVVARLSGVKQAVAWLNDNTADLLFVDIQLSDGLSFSIFEQLEVRTPVIFTTAYDQYAIQAFKLNSIDYLLKPINETELSESLRKYDQLHTPQNSNMAQLIEMLSSRLPASNGKKRFVVSYGNKIKKIETPDIAYFYASEKSVFIQTFQGQLYPSDYTLDQLERIIPADCFFRINRKLIINSKSIIQMSVLSRSRLRIELTPPLTDNMEAVVSIERSAKFKEWLDS